MKINSNIPILLILTIFVASNAILYRYLNDGYFIDKKPDTQSVKRENVIFSLIGAHELVLAERNAAILAEAQRLRELKSTITDTEELRKIEEQLRALEAESKAVLERVKNSENERKVAQKQSENDQVKLSDLLESNSQLGAALDEINEEFDTYVTTIKNSVVSNTSSNDEKESINSAFNNNRGLEYVNDLVGNVQKNRSLLQADYIKQLQDRSDSYLKGLTTTAKKLNNNNFTGIFDTTGLIDTDKSVIKLEQILDNYKLAKDRELEEKLANLSNSKDKKHQQILQQIQTEALTDKELSLQMLEKQLREDLTNTIIEKEKVIKVDFPTPDKPMPMTWVYIPSLWKSTPTELTFGGKRVDTIAWSRNSIEDNQSIFFNGNFEDKSELLLILYGNGRFKSWANGIIVSIIDSDSESLEVSIYKNGIDDNSNTLYSNTLSIDGNINGNYYVQIYEGKLSIFLNDAELIGDFPIEGDLNGRIGFGNREVMSKPFVISNIKLFKIQ